jgi:sec-independent protein translocase protein TatB
VPDIGFGEILVIVVLALLVFGPDRLPKVAADAARTLRQVRQMAASARKDLVDASGLEDDGEMAQAVRDIRDLDPRRAMKDVLTDDPFAPSRDGGSKAAPASASAAAGGVAGAASGKGTGKSTGKGVPAAGSGANGGADGPAGESGSAGPGSAEGEPTADPLADAAPVDPDWT